MDERVARMLAPIDVTRGKGLELGPLANPVVERAGGDGAIDGTTGLDIRYLDHVDTAALRDRYRTHRGFDVDAIVPIDYASDGRTIRATVGADVPFDYVVASHVIEHVPDLIGWLADLRSVLGDAGVVSLAVPDHRRCFDIVRSPSVLADMIEAHLVRAKVPSPRQVFDHYAGARSWNGLISWESDPPLAELAPVHPEAKAFERATAAADGHYEDVQCWLFTPQSFVDLFAGLHRLGLVAFDVVSCSETVGCEFFVTLRAADPAHATVPGVAPLPGRVPQLAGQREELAWCRRDLDALRVERDAMLASRSWHLTAPIRSLNAVAGRVRSKLRR